MEDIAFSFGRLEFSFLNCFLIISFYILCVRYSVFWVTWEESFVKSFSQFTVFAYFSSSSCPPCSEP